MPEQVPALAFSAMLLAGLAFAVLPKIGYPRLGIQVGLWATWGSVVFLCWHPFFGPALAVSGFIIVTLMVMIFLLDRTWIAMTILSLLAIAWLNLSRSEAMLSTRTIALMVMQLAQFLGATVLFALMFDKFQRLFTAEVATNKQLSKQQQQLETRSAELLRVNSQLSEEIIRATEAQAARDLATSELQSKTDLLEIITQSLPARVVYVDDQNNIQFFNPAFAQHYKLNGLTAPLSIDSILPQGIYDDIGSHIEQAMTTGETVIVETLETAADGTTLTSRKSFSPHVVDGKVVGRVTLSIDVTELRETQASLQQANRILKNVNDNLPARITYTNADGIILYSNRFPDQVGQQQVNLLGYANPGKRLGSSASALVHHEKLALAGEAGDFEVRIQLENGEEVIERIRYVPQMEDGNLVGIFSLVTDITESRHLEEMFQQAQKLESLGMLAGGVAHDFNNLLAGVLGQSSVALARLQENHPSRKHVTRAMNAAERASVLTKQMLAYSGKGSFSVAPFDLNALIQQNLELLQVTLPRNVELDVALANELPMIEADEAQIQQVVMNLIINAGQAIGEAHGRISVRTGVEVISAETEKFGKFTGKPLNAGTYVSVRIADTGVGIPKSEVERIFDPFYTTKQDGTGLGLAAVLGVIRGHHGDIELTTEPGVGTEFRLLLPVAESMDTMIIPLDTGENGSHAKRMDALVLVIDDEPNVLEVVADMFEFENIATLCASNGTEGIELFKAHRDEISLVLLDLMMPGMNGDEVFAVLREIDPTIHVILSSGYSEAEASRRFVGNKVADFIQKPYAITDLMKKVRNVLAVAGRVSTSSQTP